MILLSKVFPTLDCASCISTPKMAAVNNHPNVRALVYSEVDDITPRPEGGFQVHLTQKPKFIDAAKCTGCALCEPVCTVNVPDEFNYDLAARRAAHIAFPQAVPKKAVITRTGTSPCSFACPAGVKPHGYVSLVRAGQYDEAFRQHLEDAPLVGVLSRACYAPCEEQCSRAELEGTVSIRGIKRFMADRYYAAHPSPEYGPPPSDRGHRVAIVGLRPVRALGGVLPGQIRLRRDRLRGRWRARGHHALGDPVLPSPEGGPRIGTSRTSPPSGSEIETEPPSLLDRRARGAPGSMRCSSRLATRAGASSGSRAKLSTA